MVLSAPKAFTTNLEAHFPGGLAAELQICLPPCLLCPPVLGYLLSICFKAALFCFISVPEPHVTENNSPMPWDHNSLSSSCTDPGEPPLNPGHGACPSKMGLLIQLRCQTYMSPETCPDLRQWGKMGTLRVIWAVLQKRSEIKQGGDLLHSSPLMTGRAWVTGLG